MSRTKGAAGEREFAKELVRLYALHGITASAARTAPLQSGGRSFALPSTVSAADVTCDLLPDDHAEVKRCEDVRMSEWVAQAERDACGKRWFVAWRQNRQPWRVTLRLGHLNGGRIAFGGDGRAVDEAYDALVTLSLADFVAVRVARDRGSTT